MGRGLVLGIYEQAKPGVFAIRRGHQSQLLMVHAKGRLVSFRFTSLLVRALLGNST